MKKTDKVGLMPKEYRLKQAELAVGMLALRDVTLEKAVVYAHELLTACGLVEELPQEEEQ